MDKQEITRRTDLFLGEFSKLIKLSPMMDIVFFQFAPKLPELLAEADKQQDLLDLMTSLAWIMGYKAQFEPEESEDTELPGQLQQPLE